MGVTVKRNRSTVRGFNLNQNTSILVNQGSSVGLDARLDAIELALSNSSRVQVYSSPSFNIIGGVDFVLDTGLTDITYIGVYDKDEIEVTNQLIVSKTGGVVTLQSNQSLTSLFIKSIGL